MQMNLKGSLVNAATTSQLYKVVTFSHKHLTMFLRFKDKREALEPEADPERDQRTVFAYQMPLKATERDVYEFFSKAGKNFEAFGPVELVQLPTDPETGHCKGFGFIQFAQLEHAKAAQSLNGKLEIAAGRTIKVSSVTDHVGAQDILDYVHIV